MSDACQGDDPRLSAWVDDELPQPQKKALAAHILLCPVCAREVGHLAAHKCLVERPETAEEPPAGLWDGIRHELDRVDGVQQALSRASTPRRTLSPVLVAAGVVLILGALLVRTTMLGPARPVAPQLLGLHQRMLASSGMVMPAARDALHAVTTSIRPQTPRVVWQAVGSINGQFAINRLCMAGRLPVTIISTPESAVPEAGLQRRILGGRVYRVAQTPRGSVVIVHDQGLSHCLVANTTLDELLPLAQEVLAHPSLLTP